MTYLIPQYFTENSAKYIYLPVFREQTLKGDTETKQA